MRGVSSGLLLERERELEALRASAARIARGRGGVALIEGPAGIGKTRLLEAARDIAEESGTATTWARASELEQDYAWGVAVQALAPLVSSRSRADQERLFSGAAALAAPLFQPDRQGEVAGLDPDYATLHGLYWLLVELAREAPLMLCVDDVHWADPASLRFLTFTARRLESLPLGIFGSRRSGEHGSDPRLVMELVAEASDSVTRPGPLSTSAVRSLAEDMLGADASSEFASACAEATGGNPFFLSALLRELAAAPAKPDPGTVRRVVAGGTAQVSAMLARRLEALPAGAAELARAIAVLGDRSPLDRAARLAGLDPHVAGEALESLVVADVLAGEAEVAFTHPLVRSSVYAGMSASARQELHLAAARALEADGAPASAIATHLLHVGREAHPRAVAILSDAAARSLATGAPESAARFLSRALQEPLEGPAAARVLLDLGRAEMRAALPGAEEHLRQVMGHQEASAADRGRAALDLGEFFMHSFRADEGIPVLEAGLTATSGEDPHLARLLEATLVFNAFGHVDARRRLLPRLRKLEPPTGVAATDPARFLFAALAFENATAGGSAQAAVEQAEECLVYRGSIESQTAGTAIGLALAALAAADRPEEAEARADGLINFARRDGAVGVFARVTANRVIARWIRGNLPGAEADARMIIDLERDPGLEVLRPIALGAIISALVERDELQAADEVAAPYAGTDLVATITDRLLALALMDLRLAQDRTMDAVHEVGRFRRFEAAWDAPSCGGFVEWRSHAADVQAAAGEHDAAEAVATEQLGLAEEFGSERAIGCALRTVAVHQPGAAQVEMLREAVKHLSPERAALDRARALVELGAALRDQGHPREARPPLQEGLMVATRCGSVRLARRAHTALRAAGGRPRAPVRTGVDALTPSERRVAELALQGLTNSEIAQSLFLTLKTVEMHLTSTYRKLGIRARDQLGPAMEAGPGQRPGANGGYW